MSERSGNVELGQRIGEIAQRIGARQDIVAQAGKDLELDFERRLMGPGDAAFEIGQFGRGEAHGIGQVWRWMKRCSGSSSSLGPAAAGTSTK